MEEQIDFLFADGSGTELHLPDPRSGLYEEITATWGIPVGQITHVVLHGHNFSDLQGRLELSRAPDLPFDRREVLALRIGTIEFSSRQIASWAII